MKPLSKRLEQLANWIPQGAVLVDVGCDHAWLPLSLLSQGRIARAVAVDKNPAPLSLATRNATKEGWCAPRFQTVQNDGLFGLQLPQGAVVNIAGMGGESIIRILQGVDLQPFGQLVLQPNDHVHRVRSLLWKRGWGIVESTCVEEKGQFYFALLARRGEGYVDGSEEDRWLCPILRRAPTLAWRNWVRFRYRVLQEAHQRSKGALAGESRVEFEILQGLSWLGGMRAGQNDCC